MTDKPSDAAKPAAQDKATAPADTPDNHGLDRETLILARSLANSQIIPGGARSLRRVRQRAKPPRQWKPRERITAIICGTAVTLSLIGLAGYALTEKRQKRTYPLEAPDGPRHPLKHDP